jgi:NADPH:quinone reductase-like Zn-dependent oxidoreductase
MDFLIAKGDLHSTRFVDDPAPVPDAGQALLRVDAFGLSSNNITYAMFGEAMSYWSFFPAEDGWGRMPVWGFAEVIAVSDVPGLDAGTRVFGYLPPSSELLVTPARVGAHGFVDAAAHRATLPPVYNRYARTDGDPLYDADHEDEQMLLWPLFLTSYLIDDFLADNDFFAADTIVLSSASSKTSSALAFLLAQRDEVTVIGLTSARSAEFTRGLGVYDVVLGYEELDDLPPGPAVYVDMSGDAQLRNAVHEHFGEQLAHSAVVGATHHDRMGDVPPGLPGPRPMFFFAPDRVSKRTKDWGADGLAGRMADAWRPYVQWTAGWLRVVHQHGPDAMRSAYLELLDGHIDPAQAHVLSL